MTKPSTHHHFGIAACSLSIAIDMGFNLSPHRLYSALGEYRVFGASLRKIRSAKAIVSMNRAIGTAKRQIEIEQAKKEFFAALDRFVKLTEKHR